MNQELKQNKQINGQKVDHSKRKLAKIGLVSAPVLMTLHSHPVLAQNCDFSGVMSGNMSGEGGAGACDVSEYVHGEGPVYWDDSSNVSSVDRKHTTFGSVFNTIKFADLNFYEVFFLPSTIFVSEAACKITATAAGGGAKHRTGSDSLCHFLMDAGHDDGTILNLSAQDRELAQYAAACYLNAMNSGGSIPAGYFFTANQVIELYMLGEQGGGNFDVGGVTPYLSVADIITLYKNSIHP